MNPQLHDDAMQGERDHDRLDDQGDRGGDVQVRRMLDMRLPGDRERDHQRVQREIVHQAGHAVLVEQHEAHQHETAGQQVRDVEGEAVHQPARVTNSSSVARKPSISAAPRKSGTRNTRIFAIAVSNTASTKPPAASFSRYTPMPAK